MRTPSFLLAALLAAPTLHAADWPQWRGPDHTGISRETAWQADWPAEGPRTLWKASLGAGFSSFAVVGTRVFTMGHAGGQDTTFCLEADTGKVLWKHSYPAELDPRLYEGGPNATPTVSGGLVFTLGRQGQVFALREASGEVVWSRDLMKEAEFGLAEPGKDWWGFTGSPLVEGGRVILNAGTHGVALDAKTGKTAWFSGKGAASYAAPVAFTAPGGRRAVAVFAAKALHGVDAATGRPLWELPWKTAYDINAADPIFTDTHLFVSSGYRTGGALYRMEGTNFTQVWKSADMHNQMNPAVLHEGHLYGISGQNGRGGDLRCVELLTGKVLWKEPAAGMGSFVIAGGRIVLLTERGELITAPASPQGFTPTGRAQVLGGRCWTTPVLSQGRIHARNAKGDAVCLDVRPAAGRRAGLDRPEAGGLRALFPRDGVPAGWTVRAWNDVSKPGPTNSVWRVTDGILHGGQPRGSWLMSEREYGNFRLEFEFKLGPMGNSGLALRAPLRGDPAFDGLELQMADLRYNPQAKDSELTAGLYRAVAPLRQVYRPTEWNRYEVTLQGPRLTAMLNGEKVQDLNLDEQAQGVTRHDGTPAPAIKDRPRRGHLGFQELSRGDMRVQIRGVRLEELP
ncbi:MAG: hypothetical protein RJA22_1035 [Verrucomicrobiota bacterium]